MPRMLLRWLTIITALISGVLAPARAAAQEPGASVEDLALQAHIQNLRTYSHTAWSGGPLGDASHQPVRTPVGRRLEGWHLPGMAGDETVDVAAVARPLLVNFWASWCPPCRLEFPHLAEVALAPETYAFDVLFVNAADTPAAALAFLADYPAEIHTVVDEGDRLGLEVGVQSLPTSLLLVDGTVLAGHTGIVTPTITRFLDAVAAQPGIGQFVAAEHPDVQPIAVLAPVDPGDAPPLAWSRPLAGALDHEDFQDAYRFEGRAGDVVEASLSATSGELLDTYLVLMAADGTRLAENDDVEPGVITDSALTATLPADGDYLLIATRFLEAEGYGEGEYLLVVHRTAPAEAPQQDEGDGWTQRVGDGFIGYNRSVSGAVSGMNPQQLYAFEGRAGDVVSLHLVHDPGTTIQIEVKDTHLRRFALSESSDEAGTTSLDDLVLPEDGYYRIAVARPRSRDAAETWFTLTLEAAGYPDTTASGGTDATLNFGEPVGGRLDDDVYEQRWTFAGARGDTVTLAMERLDDVPGGLDGYLIVEGPDGSVLAELDDTENSVMPRIEGLTLPESGLYTVVATRFGFANGLSVGEYTLSLQRAGTTLSPETSAAAGTRWLPAGSLPAGLRRLSAGEPGTGTLDAGHLEDWYLFHGEEGDVVTLRMERRSGHLDPLLIVTDEAGHELARNDDASARTLNALIEGFMLPASGPYLVRATRYGFENGPSAGDYRLTLEGATGDDPDGALAAPNLALSTPTSGRLDLGMPHARYAIEGRAGERINVYAQRQSGDLDLALSLRSPAGRTIAANRDWLDASDARLAAVTLPASGTYVLDVLLDDLSTAGDYRLIVLPAPQATVDAGAFVPAEGLDLEVVLIWSAPVDLDLAVDSPDDGPRGAVTHQAHDFCGDVQVVPIERSVWEAGRAAAGLYRVTVRFLVNCSAQAEPVVFLLGVAADGVVLDLIGGELAREGDTYTTLLTYGAP